MSIVERIAHLTKSERIRLEYCFETGTPDFVVLADGVILGVHLNKVPFLKIITTEGSWSTAERISSD